MVIVIHSKNKIGDIDLEMVSALDEFITNASKATNIVDIVNMKKPILKLDSQEKELYMIDISLNIEIIIVIEENTLTILDIFYKDKDK